MDRTVDTPIGTLYASAGATGLTRLDFFPITGASSDVGSSFLDQIEVELNEYFAKRRSVFDTQIAPIGTDFQQQVWKQLLEIPYGATTSYRELASRLGMPTAVRAAAAANAANMLAIIVPCHRVIGASGKLQGYRGGLEAKAALIDLERGQQPMFGNNP